MKDQLRIEAALDRRNGMRPEAAASLDATLQAKADWFGKCQKCHAELRGTLTELKAHHCGPEA